MLGLSQGSQTPTRTAIQGQGRSQITALGPQRGLTFTE